jgi:outer membrane protein OmpA-like peptidoglycan-associated protein
MAFRIATILPLACAIGVFVLAATPSLAQRTRNQISGALVQLPVGTQSAAELAEAAAERRLIDEIRNVPTRAIKVEARDRLAVMAERKPGIDLEIDFDPGSAVLTPLGVGAVIELGKALSEPEFKGQVFMLVGQADGSRLEAPNPVLSDRRTEAVKQYLVEKFKLVPTNLVAVGLGRLRVNRPADGLAGSWYARVVNITP